MRLRLRLLLLLLSGAAAVAVDAAATAKACAVAPLKTLTWSCGGRCAANASCIAYPTDEVSPCNFPEGSPWRTCVLSPSSSCEIQCIKAVTPVTEFRFFVLFNASQPSEPPPTQPPGDPFRPSYPARKEEIPFESNEFVRRIGVLGFSKNTTSLRIVGSRSGDIATRGNIVDLEIDPEIFTNATQLKEIELTNINLGDRALDIASVVPRDVTWLHLRNAKLTQFPLAIKSLSQLKSLALERNYFTELPSTLALPQLSELQLDGNDLTTFNVSALPALQNLHLSDNKFSVFPYEGVLRLPALRVLHIANNPFQKKVLFSTEQFAKVSNWTTFKIDSKALDNSSCSAGQLRKLPVYPPLSVCVVSAEEWNRLQSVSVAIVTKAPRTDSVNSSTSSPESELSTSPTLENSPAKTSSTDIVVVQGVVGAVIGFVLVVAATAAFVLWKRKQSSAGESDSTTHVGSSRDNDQDAEAHASVKFEDSAAVATLPSIDTLDLQSIRLAHTDLHDLHVIGSGSSGSVVWLVRFRKSRQLASKRLIGSQHDNSEAHKARRAAFLREIQIASMLSYPTIVTFVGVAWRTESDLQALFEYMPGGDLQSLLSDTSPESSLSWKDQKLQLAIDVITAIVYTHSYSPVVLHRNLRAHSVLLTDDGKAKLSNFSDARRASEEATMTTTGVGSSRWLAPEFLLGSSSYDAPSDIYAFGVLLSEVDTHQLPYSDVVDADGNPLPESALLQRVAKDRLRPSFSSECPPEISELAAQCLEQEPPSRPTALQVAFTLRKLLQANEL